MLPSNEFEEWGRGSGVSECEVVADGPILPAKVLEESKDSFSSFNMGNAIVEVG